MCRLGSASCCGCANVEGKMNIMRKLMGVPGGGSGSVSGRRSVSGLYDGSSGAVSAQPVDNSLGLMHLRKLYSELKSSTGGSSQRDLENMLYNMLPLFCKVSHSFCCILQLFYLLLVQGSQQEDILPKG